MNAVEGSLPAERPDLPALALTTRPRESAVADIARQLLSQLLSGPVAPGTRLPSERQLADSLGVGRSTIREALKALDVLGIIEVRPGDGTYLRQNTSDLLPQAIEWGLMLGQPKALELIEARAHVEVTIAELGARRADDAAITRLRGYLADMRDAADSAAFVEADVAFHLELARAAGNSVLKDILVSIRSLLQVWIRRAIHQSGGVETTLAEHEALLAALEARSPRRAATAMRQHMNAASKRLQSSLQKDKS